MEKNFPFVSIIIPVLNEENFIADCLNAISQVDYHRDSYEIIVVDNGSNDKTTSIVNNFPVTLLKEEKSGCAAARNLGIKHSRGDIIISTDADCIVSKSWLRELVAVFQKKEAEGVAGEVVAYPPKTPAEIYAAKVRHISPQKYLSRPLLPFAAFANLAFRREVFEKIGYLDEDIPLGESTDFCTRFFRQAYFKFEYAPKAVVFHRHRTTIKSFFRQQIKYGRDHSQLYIKYKNDIPWNWQKSMTAYKELLISGWTLSKNSIKIFDRRKNNNDINYHFF